MNELQPYLALLYAWRWRLAIGAALMFLTVAAGVGLLALSGWFITATGVTALLLAAGAQARLEIYVPGAGIRTFALVRTVARYFERLYNHDAVLRLLADLRARVFKGLTPLDPATLARFRGALVLNRLTADIDALDTLYLRCLAPPLVGVAGIVLVGAIIGVAAPMTGFIIAATLLVATVALTVAVARPGIGLGERISAHLESLRSGIVDHVRGLSELRAFALLAQHRGRIDTRARKLIADQARSARLAAAGEAGMGLIIHLAVALVLFMGLQLHAEERVGGAIVAMMTLAVLALAEGLAPVPGGFLQLGRTRAAARRLNAQMATRPAIREPEQPRPMPAGNHIELLDVVVRYGPGDEPALQRMSLEIAQGERLAVIGPSGAGKSTLADLIARLVEPESGSVRLDGVPLDALPLAGLHERIGYLTQRTEIFADTIAANLRLAAAQASDEQLWDVLGEVELREFVAGLENGLATWVGENGVRLSGGQA
ncbi:MAG: thiol reductant ABC exporter subunit CydC, partial [Halofilum sp. (in: g-proteobacteria)]